MSNTAIALALVASSNAMLASSQASSENDKTLYCNTIMPEFNPTIATVEQKQEYASCVDHFYPKLDQFDVIVIKIAIVLAFVGVFILAYKAWKDEDLILGLLGGIIAAIILPIVFIAAAYALRFLFS